MMTACAARQPGIEPQKEHFIRHSRCHTHVDFEEFHKAGIPEGPVNVIGGGATSNFWLQMLADVTNRKLLQVEQPLEACARGAALVAAVGLGFYKDFAEVEKVISLTGAEFTPNPELRGLYDQAYANFRSLYQPLSDIGNRRIPPVG
jgi:xylulokinase